MNSTFIARLEMRCSCNAWAAHQVADYGYKQADRKFAQERQQPQLRAPQGRAGF
jgi:hypothetical protein